MISKVCTKCNLPKSVNEFGKRSASPDGLAYLCNSCRREYRKENSERRAKYQKDYYSDENRREQRKAKAKRYFSENKQYFKDWNSSYYADPSNKKKRLERQRRWVEKNRCKVRLYQQKRRELRLGLDESYQEEDILYTFNLFDNKCFKCSSSESLSIDHHIPLSMNEGLSRSNAVILCRSCNSKKRNKHPKAFYTKQELERLRLLGIITK